MSSPDQHVAVLSIIHYYYVGFQKGSGERFMGWIEDLQGKVIGLGTASLFLYIINDTCLPSSSRLQVLVLNNLRSF